MVQALAPGHLDGFVLFWRAVFGLQADPVWELPDPFGIVRSRTLSSADRSVRLPLNVSESRQTTTGRFVSAYAGAGVHHIAFAAPDVAAAATPEAPMLDIPENYYDDLAARFDLGRRANSPGCSAGTCCMTGTRRAAASCHAYTHAFQDRFFFELVERRGRYDQYGAPNAGGADGGAGAAAEEVRSGEGIPPAPHLFFWVLRARVRAASLTSMHPIPPTSATMRA